MNQSQWSQADIQTLVAERLALYVSPYPLGVGHGEHVYDTQIDDNIEECSLCGIRKRTDESMSVIALIGFTR